MTSTNATTTSTPVKVRGVRVFRPDERRCADPDRPVRIEIAGVAYADLNADEAGQIAAALIAAAGESAAVSGCPPPARAFLGEPACGKPGCPCGGTA